MSDFSGFNNIPILSLDELIIQGDIKLGRGNIISKIDIRSNKGNFPIYSSSSKNNGKMGEYGKYMFNEELVTWSVDGGGTFFYRPKHKFSVTNVSGYIRVNIEKFDYRFLHGVLDYQHLFLNFDYQTKAHPSVIRELYDIPCLPLPEQKKIASILTSVDEVIENTQKQINKLQDLKKATMNELLTKGIGHTEFKDSELGRIPKSWEMKKFGEFAKITKLAGFEYTNHFDYSIGGEIIAIRALNLTNKKLDLTDIHTIPKHVSDGLPRSKLFVGDILISYVGTVGRLGLVDADNRYHLAPNVGKISFNQTLFNSQFIFFQMTHIRAQKQIENLTSVTSQPSINMANIRKIILSVPSFNEQKEIASILSEFDKGLEFRHKKLYQTQSLKKSLMQDLLTGKVRVKGN